MGDRSLVTQIQSPNGTITTTTTNVDNSVAYGDQQAYGRHIESEGKRITKQTEAIMKVCKDCTGEAKAYSDSMKMVMLAYGPNFKVAGYELEKSKTWTDVASEAIKPLVGLGKTTVLVGGAVDFADSMLDKAGATSIVMGDNGSIDKSFTNETSESNASTMYGDAEINQENPRSDSGSGGGSSEDEEGDLYCTGDSQCEDGFVCDEPIFTCVPKDY